MNLEDYINAYINANDNYSTLGDTINGDDYTSTQTPIISNNTSYLNRILPALGAMGMAILPSNQKGQYYVKSNWRGKGLSDTGLGYISNQNYTNPYSFGQMLRSGMELNRTNKGSNNSIQDLLSNTKTGIGNISSKLKDWFNTQNINNKYNTIGDLYSNISNIG